MENIYWAAAFILACIALYRFGLPVLRRFDAENVARIARQEQDKAAERYPAPLCGLHGFADISPLRFEDIHKGNAMLLLENPGRSPRSCFALRLNVISLLA